MIEEDLQNKARNTIFRLLNIRQYSEKEIRDKLTTKKIPPGVIDSTVSYFKDLSLIDDRQFTERWIAYRLARPWGLKRICLELREKGIDNEIIEKGLQQAAKDYHEPEIVTAVARKQFLKYKNIDPAKAKQRLYGYLVRRGFSCTSINKVLENL